MINIAEKAIQDYIIIQRLAFGSFGIVYKVTKKSEQNRKIYILKQIPFSDNNNTLEDTTKKLNQIQNESKILSTLSCKYIVKYYDSFIDFDNNNLNIIMEYCENGDLNTFLEKIRENQNYLNENQIWKFFIQISLGLYCLHNKNIIHRDLKPMNIFLTKNNEIKIGDLGVAKMLSTNTTKAFTSIGTPFYLSPEICEEKAYNNKIDVWALGCILYELCTLKKPFDASNKPALFMKIIEGKYIPLNKVNLPIKYSNDLCKMIDILLEIDYVKRPPMKDVIEMKIFKEKIMEMGFEGDLNEIKGLLLINNNYKKILEDNKKTIEKGKKCSLKNLERINSSFLFKPKIIKTIGNNNMGNNAGNITHMKDKNIDCNFTKEKIVKNIFMQKQNNNNNIYKIITKDHINMINRNNNNHQINNYKNKKNPYELNTNQIENSKNKKYILVRKSTIDTSHYSQSKRKKSITDLNHISYNNQKDLNSRNIKTKSEQNENIQNNKKEMLAKYNSIGSTNRKKQTIKIIKGKKKNSYVNIRHILKIKSNKNFRRNVQKIKMISHTKESIPVKNNNTNNYNDSSLIEDKNEVLRKNHSQKIIKFEDLKIHIYKNINMSVKKTKSNNKIKPSNNKKILSNRNVNMSKKYSGDFQSAEKLINKNNKITKKVNHQTIITSNHSKKRIRNKTDITTKINNIIKKNESNKKVKLKIINITKGNTNDYSNSLNKETTNSINKNYFNMINNISDDSNKDDDEKLFTLNDKNDLITEEELNKKNVDFLKKYNENKMKILKYKNEINIDQIFVLYNKTLKSKMKIEDIMKEVKNYMDNHIPKEMINELYKLFCNLTVYDMEIENINKLKQKIKNK